MVSDSTVAVARHRGRVAPALLGRAASRGEAGARTASGNCEFIESALVDLRALRIWVDFRLLDSKASLIWVGFSIPAVVGPCGGDSRASLMWVGSAEPCLHPPSGGWTGHTQKVRAGLLDDDLGTPGGGRAPCGRG